MNPIIDPYREVLDLVDRFVDRELLPYERKVMEREIAGEGRLLPREDLQKLDSKAKEYGLFALDVTTDLGGMDLPAAAMCGVYEALGHTIVYYLFPPDAINLRMLQHAATDYQRTKYLEPSARAEIRSQIVVSEPGGGGDPAGMTTRAVKEGDEWVLNGRKIWISNAPDVEFLIVMAATGAKGARREISSFIIDQGTPGFNIVRRIPMIGGMFTYEILIENCRVPATQLLGTPGEGFGPMQYRFSLRRLQLAAWCLGAAQRALDMMMEYAPQRKTFGLPLSERQAIQWWVADAATQIHSARLMLYDAGWRLDQGDDARIECAMVKIHLTEVATKVIDNAMQTFGAMGMTKELPLQFMANTVRWIRVGEGPSEVHRAYIARHLWRRQGTKISS